MTVRGAPSHLFIIGAQRCGTTSVLEALTRHPDVSGTRVVRPEPKVFLEENSAQIAVDTYRDLFQEQTQWLVEKSTSYLESPEAIRRILRVLPEAYFLVVLRHPVDRAASHYWFSRSHGVEPLPPTEALRPEAEDRPWDEGAISVSPFRYLSRGKYVDYLESVLPITGDRLRVVTLEELTGVDGPARMWDLFGLGPPEGRLRLERLNGTSEQGSLSRSLREELAEYFSPSVDRLEDLLARSFQEFRGPGRQDAG